MAVPTWLYEFTSASSNRLAWRVAAALAATTALVAVLLTLYYPQSGPVSPPVAVVVPPSASPGFLEGPGLAGRKANPNPPPRHLERLVAFCQTLVTAERSFVVFENGTCVIVNEPSANPVRDALAVLDECSAPNARFVTSEIEHGNYLVTYKKAAFNCLFADEIEASREEIETGFPAYLTALERRDMPAGWSPPFHAKLGIVARSRLNADARNHRVTKVIKAAPIGPAPRLSAIPDNPS